MSDFVGRYPVTGSHPGGKLSDGFFFCGDLLRLDDGLDQQVQSDLLFRRGVDGLLKKGIVEGKVVDEATIKELSLLPNRDGMLSMLLSCLQSPVSSFARVVKAVAEAKEAGTPAPAAEEAAPAAEAAPAEAEAAA